MIGYLFLKERSGVQIPEATLSFSSGGLPKTKIYFVPYGMGIFYYRLITALKSLQLLDPNSLYVENVVLMLRKGCKIL